MSWNRLTLWFVSLVVMGTLGLTPAPLRAADWPGWRGPDRTGVSPETGLLKGWPKDGPKLLWKAKGMGEGYSTPSVAGGRVYVLGAKDKNEYAMAVDAKDGKQIWATKIGPEAKDGPPSYPGPRSTPTVDGERIYVLGSDGDLVCLDKGGKMVWQKNLDKDLEGSRGHWAYAESPLIDGDVLVCTPGGAKVSLAALNKNTGEVIWKTQVPDGGPAAYTSAIIADAAGVKQYVQFLEKGVVGVSAKDGKFLWKYDKNAGRTNASTAIYHDGFVFNSAAGPGSGGNALLKLNADAPGVSVKEVYSGKALSNHHGGIVRIGDHVYGTSNTNLVCLEFKTGDVKWQNASVGKGPVSAADGHLYVRGEKSGQVALVEATPDGYKEKGRFSPVERSKKNAWCHPVIAGGCLYLRDDDVLLCYEIKAQ